MKSILLDQDDEGLRLRCGDQVVPLTLRGAWQDLVEHGSLWAVGDHGVIVRHNLPLGHEEGWQLVHHGAPTDQLHAVWGTGPRDIWAVGARGLLLHWDGLLWSVVDPGPALPPAEARLDLFGVFCAQPHQLWAVGAGGLILFFDGASWQLESHLGGAVSLFAVGGTSDTGLVAVGEAGTMLQREPGTRRWRTLVPVTTADLYALCPAPAGEQIYACGAEGTVVHRDAETRRWRHRSCPLRDNALAMLHDGTQVLVAGSGGAVWQLKLCGESTGLPGPRWSPLVAVPLLGHVLAFTEEGLIGLAIEGARGLAIGTRGRLYELQEEVPVEPMPLGDPARLAERAYDLAAILRTLKDRALEVLAGLPPAEVGRVRRRWALVELPRAPEELAWAYGRRLLADAEAHLTGDVLGHLCLDLMELGTGGCVQVPLPTTFEQVKARIGRAVVAAHGGNLGEAAKQLRVARGSLRRWLGAGPPVPPASGDVHFPQVALPAETQGWTYRSRQLCARAYARLATHRGGGGGWIKGPSGERLCLGWHRYGELCLAAGRIRPVGDRWQIVSSTDSQDPGDRTAAGTAPR